MTQKLTGAALLAEVDQNPKMAATQLAMRTGYMKQSRSRSGEGRVKPDLEAYYQALLLAKGEFFGLVMPETQRASSRGGDVDSFKIQKNGAGIVPRRFMEMLGCEPGDYFAVKEGEDGTLAIARDVERSEAARIEAAANPVAITAEGSEEDEDEEDEDVDEDEDGEEVVVQQPAIPDVNSTTVRIAQPVS